MPEYTTQNRNRMADPMRISKSQLEPGMVAKLKYTKLDGSTRDFYVFVLNPKYKKHLHCLDLKHVNPPQMVSFAKNLDEVFSNTPKIKRLNLTKMQLDEDANKFYISNVKNFKLTKGYRTLIEKNITSVTVYNYYYGIYDKISPKSPSDLERRYDIKGRKD